MESVLVVGILDRVTICFDINTTIYNKTGSGTLVINHLQNRIGKVENLQQNTTRLLSIFDS